MGILPKEKLIGRLIIGDMLIYKEIRASRQLSEEVVKKLEKLEGCLMRIARALKRSAELEKEETLLSYYQELASSPEILRDRRLAINNCIKEIFLEKDTDKIARVIKNKLKSDESLKDLKGEKGEIDLPIFVDDIDYNCLMGANYDLRLGEDVYVTTEKTPRKLNVMGADGVIGIEPGEFGILMTHEYIFVPPDLIGFISIRLTFKQKGLVNISGFHADPGFYGRLMFAVYNAGPNDVPLRYKERVFMIMFNELTKPWPKIKKSKWHGMKDIPIETIFGLRGTSVSVRNLDERVKRLEMLFPIVVTGVVGVVVAVITWILTHLK